MSGTIKESLYQIRKKMIKLKLCNCITCHKLLRMLSDMFYTIKAICYTTVGNVLCNLSQMFKSVALQLHEQQLAKLQPRRTEERIIRILIGWSSKALRDKLLEGCYSVQRQLKVAAIVTKSRTEFYFVQRCTQQKCCETSCRGNMLHHTILQQLVLQRCWGTSCWEHCTV